MSSVSCTICLEVVTSTSIVSSLSCGHAYHQDCLNDWLKTSRTCPECRNAATTINRIYLNLVPDPEIEVLSTELTKKSNDFEYLTTAHDIQDVVIKHLEKELSRKDEELASRAKKNDEIETSRSCLLHENEKLKLELNTKAKQQEHLTNDVADLIEQLATSQTKNIEISNSSNSLKGYYREQIKQNSELNIQMINLTEQLDQFRGLLLSANTALQVQIDENQMIKTERDTLFSRHALLSRNTSLILKTLKMHMQQKFMISRMIRSYKRRSLTFKEKMKIKLEKIRFSKHHRKKKTESDQASNENLKLKLVKSKLNWKCVKC